ncbi:MAG: hypothetical protein WC852_05365 [Candidatus Nanoarchaeia archaeon]|jgi:hypothetical protein
MAIEELLKNPEEYRAGENYKASNIVFPVVFEGQKYIVKKPRALSSLIEPYYVLQDKFFLGTRMLSTARRRITMEAARLETLAGKHAPRLIAYGNKTLVREYLEGRDFRSLDSDEERKMALKKAVEALDNIHLHGVVIGDAHVKNIFLTKGDEVRWLDMDGIYGGAVIADNLSCVWPGAAVDMLKFIYSTYTATRNPDLTLYSANLVVRTSYFYRDGTRREVGRQIEAGNRRLRGGLGLWFATRMPRDSHLNWKIGDILSLDKPIDWE